MAFIAIYACLNAVLVYRVLLISGINRRRHKENMNENVENVSVFMSGMFYLRGKLLVIFSSPLLNPIICICERKNCTAINP